ncbi:LysR substrate-binding domain-containing protein [Streptomyces sp. NPDC000351]|uniref:LysR substrate-binding domain-containing protein n=1 Tax=Streptomyces sp. NPDC000351 TaxID=3154250 RepID=UPI00331C5545
MYTSEISRQWKAANPEVLVRLKRIDEPVGGFTTGQSDVAIMRTHIGRHSLHVEPLVTEPRVVAAPSGCPLIRLDEVLPRDQADCPPVTTPSPQPPTPACGRRAGNPWWRWTRSTTGRATSPPVSASA